MTRRQREVLDTIRVFVQRNGYSPSLAEIARSLGLTSTATVHKHVGHLVDKGFVRRTWNQNRSIEIVSNEPTVEVPVVDVMGEPSPAVDAQDRVAVPVWLLGGRLGVAAIRVRGGALREDALIDGDVIFVDRTGTPRDGDVILATVDDEPRRVRRFFRSGARIRLEPLVSGSDAVITDGQRVRVEGVVVAALRKM